MAIITAVKGFKDILPDETGKWYYIESKAREIFTVFGFREIRVPILERTDLFIRSIGESTDIVEKEMYTFLDKGDENLTLRPEATASIIRAYLEHSLFAADAIVKLFTMGPMFRRERPQKGRYRQFNQINVELLGIDDPRIDAEVILMLIHFLRSVGVSSFNLEINSLGCPKCRPAFRETLAVFLKGREDKLCNDCQRRLITNPLRIYDCKNENCSGILLNAPQIVNFICPTCLDHFEKVKDSLTSFGIVFEINSKLVRGLDYYTRTTFEVTTGLLGAQNAIAGGGRYDGLVKNLGGPDIPGVGFAIGLERLISMIEDEKEVYTNSTDLFIAALGEEARKMAYEICNRLRMRGISAETDHSAKSLKSQMKRADKLNSRYTLIIGEQELLEGEVKIRDMRRGTQESIRINELDEAIIDIIKER